jgi:hypothetical protein
MEEREQRVQFAFNKLNDKVIESNDLAHVSIEGDLLFQKVAILYAEIYDTWDGKNEACRFEIPPKYSTSLRLGC